jgi:hypothetical protein
MIGWRARWDLNPGFSAPEADALSVLDYEPTVKRNQPHKEFKFNPNYS